MCYHEFEKFGCGHEEKHKIPCEDVCENKPCTKPEEDQVRDRVGKCSKCKDVEDDMDFIQEELRKFAERESLNPSAAPSTRTRDPYAPRLYFKRCLVWTKCGHHSHPRPSDIERDEGDQEYLHVEGIGNCFDCSAAPASTLTKMKQDGDYDKEDPWGAMSRSEVAEGSSRDTDIISLEEIGQGVSHAQAKQQAHEDALDSPPLSPVMSGARSISVASSESEYDMGPTKGKGRPGEPTGQPTHTSMGNSDGSHVDEVGRSLRSGVMDSQEAIHPALRDGYASSKEWDTPPTRSKSPTSPRDRSPQTRLSLHSVRAGLADSDEDDEHSSGNEGAHGKIPHWGRDTMHHAPGHEEKEDDFDSASSVYSQSDGDDDCAEHNEHDEHDEHRLEGQKYASPEELKAAKFPSDGKVTSVELQSILKLKAQGGQMATTQAREGKTKSDTNFFY